MVTFKEKGSNRNMKYYANLARERELYQLIEDLRKLKPVPQMVIYILIDTLTNLILPNKKVVYFQTLLQKD